MTFKSIKIVFSSIFYPFPFSPPSCCCCYGSWLRRNWSCRESISSRQSARALPQKSESGKSCDLLDAEGAGVSIFSWIRTAFFLLLSRSWNFGKLCKTCSWNTGSGELRSEVLLHLLQVSNQNVLKHLQPKPHLLMPAFFTGFSSGWLQLCTQQILGSLLQAWVGSLQPAIGLLTNIIILSSRNEMKPPGTVIVLICFDMLTDSLLLKSEPCWSASGLFFKFPRDVSCSQASRVSRSCVQSSLKLHQWELFTAYLL